MKRTFCKQMILSKEVKPVQILYHGTTLSHVKDIHEKGLQPINYDKVYLTSDIVVAYEYAKSRSLIDNLSLKVICIVDAKQMYIDGFVFTHEQSTAECTVDYVPSKYIISVIIESEEDLDKLAHYAQKQFYEDN